MERVLLSLGDTPAAYAFAVLATPGGRPRSATDAPSSAALVTSCFLRCNSFLTARRLFLVALRRLAGSLLFRFLYFLILY
jgi:hypothetical protein